jgi:SAM-dependent methyltransferase
MSSGQSPKKPRIENFTKRLRSLVASNIHFNQIIGRLENRHHDLESRINDLTAAKETLFKVYEDQRTESEKQHNRVRSLDVRVSDLTYQVASLEQSTTKNEIIKPTTSAGKKLQADDHMLDNFYVLFENHFRGSETDIRSRQEKYLPYLENSTLLKKNYPVLDIGSGRGEFIALLKEHGITATGLDLNESMVSLMKEKGLDGQLNDAYNYLRSCKSDSLMAITGFHLVEHIPFPDLLRIFTECYRVLAPNGFVIFETPNPENTTVGSNNFYIDPSHLHPLPPAVLQFALETRGFSNAEILRLNPIKKTINHPDPAVKKLMENFFGPQDYAAIAFKS